MKNLIISFAVAMIFTLLHAGKSNAQLLKQILNSAKQTAQNRANNKADQITNKLLDKVDSATQVRSGSGSSSTGSSGTNNNSSDGTPSDNPAMNKVLSAFGKAATDNPSDTSASDLTMKALGNLVGGGGVSSADSAAAIQSFMFASGGSGFMYKEITTVTSKNGTNKDTSTRYFTGAGYGRNEMRMNLPGAMSDEIITIGQATQPRYSISLDPVAKTYALNVIDTSLINSDMDTYTVSKVGNEKVGGYNSIHSKVTSSMNTKYFNSSTTFDVWTSTEVPGYALLEKYMTMQNLKPDMIETLKQAACEGFFVKIESKGDDYSMEMLQIKAVSKNLPASLFEIPAGYGKSDKNMLYNLVPSSK